MATVLTDSAHYTAIADAIRARTGRNAAYTPAQMPAAIAALTGGGVQSETISGEYTDTDRLDFRREISGTPLYAELTSTADADVTYGQSYWIKSGFLFFSESGEVDTEKSYYYVCEDGMNFGYKSDVTSNAVALCAPGSISTLYQDSAMGGFLPDTGETPVSYTIKLVYAG